MELSDLVEDSIIADLNLDPAIAVWNPEPHDGPNAKAGLSELSEGDDQLVLVVVSAEDRGDFDGASGAGIRVVGVEIELTQNVGINPDTSVVSGVAEKIADRLPATHLSDFSRHLAFCTNRLKVFRIESSETERTEDIDLVRQRIIAREFLCAQVG
jgi:hypothetical protein